MNGAAARLSSALEGRYRIERELGKGGMATIYLAEDLKHHRKVAIKVLKPEIAAALGADRFLSEIRTTAQLHHPHILPLHDSGSVEGILYYVMPWVEGGSLRDRLSGGAPLPIEEAVQIMVQVAGALDYAHRRGVIHRDIKPENILLQEDQALVADFGIALGTDSGTQMRLTETGLSLGTPQYMSPEQALGDRALDARTDVYAAGVTLYETLTGTPPFTGPTASAIAAKVLTEDAAPPSGLRPEIPPHLDAAILTAIDKNPDRRFHSAASFAHALTTTTPSHMSAAPPTPTPGQVESAAAGPLVPKPRRRRGRLIGMLVTGATAVLAVAGYLLVHGAEESPAGAGGGARSIAAIPFENFSRNANASAYLADGIPEELLGNLADIPLLAVRPMAQDNRFRDHPDLAVVASQLHADIILTGSVLAVGDSVRVTVRPYDAHHNVYLASVAVTAGSSNVFGLEDSISHALIARLPLAASVSHTVPAVHPARPVDPAAHDSLLLARWYVARRDCASLGRGIELLTSATRLDSTYARAWANLAQAHNLRAAFFCARGIDEFVPARAAVERALALDSNEADAHMTLGFLNVIANWDWPDAAQEFTRAVALDSTEAEVWLFRSWYYVAVGRLDSARASIRRAAALDPSSSIIRTRVGTVLYMSDSLDAAAAEVHDVLSREPGFGPAAAQLAEVYTEAHRCDDARAALGVPNLGVPGEVVYVLARCGGAAAARDSLQQLEARASGGAFVPPFQIAVAYAGLGEPARVFSWLNRAVAERDWQLWQLWTHPAFRPYRAMPAFQALLKKVRSPLAE